MYSRVAPRLSNHVLSSTFEEKCVYRGDYHLAFGHASAGPELESECTTKQHHCRSSPLSGRSLVCSTTEISSPRLNTGQGLSLLRRSPRCSRIQADNDAECDIQAVGSPISIMPPSHPKIAFAAAEGQREVGICVLNFDAAHSQAASVTRSSESTLLENPQEPNCLKAPTPRDCMMQPESFPQVVGYVPCRRPQTNLRPGPATLGDEMSGYSRQPSLSYAAVELDPRAASAVQTKHEHVKAHDRDLVSVQSLMARLPRANYQFGADEHAEHYGTEQKFCIICLENYSPEDTRVWLPCLHDGHWRCMKLWLSRSTTPANARCPVCAVTMKEFWESLAQEYDDFSTVVDMNDLVVKAKNANCFSSDRVPANPNPICPSRLHSVAEPRRAGASLYSRSYLSSEQLPEGIIRALYRSSNPNCHTPRTPPRTEGKRSRRRGSEPVLHTAARAATRLRRLTERAAVRPVQSIMH